MIGILRSPHLRVFLNPLLYSAKEGAKMIYLDNSATSPIDEEVRDAMLPYLNEEFGNPSSKYYCKATHAKNAVEEAREKVARLLGAKPDEIIFTAGATESISRQKRFCREGAKESRSSSR